jgi:hypothetical protein
LSEGGQGIWNSFRSVHGSSTGNVFTRPVPVGLITSAAFKLMKNCSPSKFLRRWPGSLRPLVLPDPPPSLPAKDRDLLTTFGLPDIVTIYCYNDITLTFSGSATPFGVIWERDLQRGYKMGEMPAEWNRFWHLADQEYVQGGGWICLEEGTGRLMVINLDAPLPVYLLNANVRNFYTTLAYFLDWSEKTDGSHAETAALRDALLNQHCIAPEELEPYWMNFIYATLDCDRVRLAVHLGPKNVKWGDAPGQGVW